jgi:hypothetical protein
MPKGVYDHYKIRGKLLSEKHKERIQKNHSHYWRGKKQTKEHIKKATGWCVGKNCPFWRGGKMKDYPELVRIRKSIEYRLWRKSVFKRDNFICQKCELSGGYLIAHHINNFADFPELRLAIDNGVTLCKKCHEDFHKRYSRKNNTKEQLEEFLS